MYAIASGSAVQYGQQFNVNCVCCCFYRRFSMFFFLSLLVCRVCLFVWRLLLLLLFITWMNVCSCIVCSFERAVIINFIKTKNKNYTHRTNKNSNVNDWRYTVGFNACMHLSVGNNFKNMDHHDQWENIKWVNQKCIKLLYGMYAHGQMDCKESLARRSLSIHLSLSLTLSNAFIHMQLDWHLPSYKSTKLPMKHTLYRRVCDAIEMSQ